DLHNEKESLILTRFVRSGAKAGGPTGNSHKPGVLINGYVRALSECWRVVHVGDGDCEALFSGGVHAAVCCSAIVFQHDGYDSVAIGIRRRRVRQRSGTTDRGSYRKQTRGIDRCDGERQRLSCLTRAGGDVRDKVLDRLCSGIFENGLSTGYGKRRTVVNRNDSQYERVG